MKGPRLERTASLITVPPASGKYEKSERGPAEGKSPYLYILVVVLGFDASRLPHRSFLHSLYLLRETDTLVLVTSFLAFLSLIE